MTERRDATPPARLSVRGLHAGYGRTEILHGVDVDVMPGEVVGLLGSNGAGKSTLARAITGFCNVTRGEVTLGEEQLVGRSPYTITRTGIGHMPEGRRLFGRLTVTQNLELALSWQKLSTSQKHHMLEEVLEWFPPLRDRGMQSARTLSGGEQQMLAIARALLLNPRILILDEPSSGLAPIIVEQIFEIIRRLREELGISMLVIEQNVAATLELADRGYVLQRGRIVGTGSASELLEDAEIKSMYLGK